MDLESIQFKFLFQTARRFNLKKNELSEIWRIDKILVSDTALRFNILTHVEKYILP